MLDTAGLTRCRCSQQECHIATPPESGVWPQEPVGAVLVAGNMAIAVDVQGESIFWDLQQVPKIAVLAR